MSGSKYVNVAMWAKCVRLGSPDAPRTPFDTWFIYEYWLNPARGQYAPAKSARCTQLAFLCRDITDRYPLRVLEVRHICRIIIKLSLVRRLAITVVA